MSRAEAACRTGTRWRVLALLLAVLSPLPAASATYVPLSAFRDLPDSSLSRVRIRLQHVVHEFKLRDAMYLAVGDSATPYSLFSDYFLADSVLEHFYVEFDPERLRISPSEMRTTLRVLASVPSLTAGRTDGSLSVCVVGFRGAERMGFDSLIDGATSDTLLLRLAEALSPSDGLICAVLNYTRLNIRRQLIPRDVSRQVALKAVPLEWDPRAEYFDVGIYVENTSGARIEGPVRVPLHLPRGVAAVEPDGQTCAALDRGIWGGSPYYVMAVGGLEPGQKASRVVRLRRVGDSMQLPAVGIVYAGAGLP